MSPHLIVTDEARKLGLAATYLVEHNLPNRARDVQFEQLKQARCKELIQKYSGNFIDNDTIVQGFRTLRQTTGRSPCRYPCSIESLTRYLQRHRSLPHINLIVDIYNLVSLVTRLTLGAHDLDHVDGNITLGLTQGNEPFYPSGGHQAESVETGEYCYQDESGQILCRLDYKQCDRSKISLSTTRCLFIIQGHAQTPISVLSQARERLIGLLLQFCPGKIA